MSGLRERTPAAWARRRGGGARGARGGVHSGAFFGIGVWIRVGGRDRGWGCWRRSGRGRDRGSGGATPVER